MALSIPGIIINVIMVILIVVIIIFGVIYSGDRKQCETNQSTFCHTIQCPCDNAPGTQTQPPCLGYAKMPGNKPGTWKCSNAPLTVVDDAGNIV